MFRLKEYYLLFRKLDIVFCCKESFRVIIWFNYYFFYNFFDYMIYCFKFFFKECDGILKSFIILIKRIRDFMNRI